MKIHAAFEFLHFKPRAFIRLSILAILTTDMQKSNVLSNKGDNP